MSSNGNVGVGGGGEGASGVNRSLTRLIVGGAGRGAGGGSFTVTINGGAGGGSQGVNGTASINWVALRVVRVEQPMLSRGGLVVLVVDLDLDQLTGQQGQYQPEETAEIARRGGTNLLGKPHHQTCGDKLNICPLCRLSWLKFGKSPMEVKCLNCCFVHQGGQQIHPVAPAV